MDSNVVASNFDFAFDNPNFSDRVASCIQYCSQRLNKLPMTCEFALSCLDRLSSVLLSDAFQRLADSAKQFIVVTFNDKNKFENQFLNLSLAGVETILSCDDIQLRNWKQIFFGVTLTSEQKLKKTGRASDQVETVNVKLFSCVNLSRSPMYSKRIPHYIPAIPKLKPEIFVVAGVENLDVQSDSSVLAERVDEDRVKVY
ncbi:hypothetical protein POM88_024921 [Heracleum sosnowskyi]|uniref:Uncharacterized protein n=1 Tax=Heracleum sosnowskyi TaxID=360622 RepID=A0AAD8I553_9APIA|nr:hypothetical protein POM88_024921 [Heracleum sosnowskyi]